MADGAWWRKWHQSGTKGGTTGPRDRARNSSRYGGEAMTARVVTCQRCGYLTLRVATVREAAAVAAKHVAQAGHDADSIFISPLRRGEVAR